MRFWSEYEKRCHSLCRPSLSAAYLAEEQSAIALDDLFPAFRASVTLLLDFGAARRLVKKAIFTSYHAVQLSP